VLQERDCVLAALVALFAPLQLEVLGARVRQQLEAGLLLLLGGEGANQIRKETPAQKGEG
jgi:hypothetical protein